MSLTTVLKRDRTIRSIGFDDAPFARDGVGGVSLAGVVCAGTRFEGMVWGEVIKDGFDATEKLVRLLENGKFLPQLHVVLLDGIAFGGFNVVDLEELHERLELPCITVIRGRPDMEAIEAALQHLPEPERRLATIRRAGPVHDAGDVFFQAVGVDPEIVPEVLSELTRTGHIPEPIRMAHLIGSAVKTGESGKRA